MAKSKKLQNLIEAARNILIEFDEWGEVLQCGPDDGPGEYGPTSAIEQLRKAYKDAEGGT